MKNGCRLSFYDNMGKVHAELVLFAVEKARVLHLKSFLLPVPL